MAHDTRDGPHGAGTGVCYNRTTAETTPGPVLHPQLCHVPSCRWAPGAFKTMAGVGEHPHPVPCTLQAKDKTKYLQGTAPSAANPAMVCARLTSASLNSHTLMQCLIPINTILQLQVTELDSQLASGYFFLFFFFFLFSPFQTVVALTCSAAALKPRRMFLLKEKKKKAHLFIYTLITVLKNTKSSQVLSKMVFPPAPLDRS